MENTAAARRTRKRFLKCSAVELFMSTGENRYLFITDGRTGGESFS